MANQPSDLEITRSAEFRPFSLWREFAAFFLLLLEISWLAPWYRQIIPAAMDLTSIRIFVGLFTILLFAYSITRILDWLRLLSRLQLTIFTLFFLVSLIVAARILQISSDQSFLRSLVEIELNTAALVVIGFWLWFRGLQLARVFMEPTAVWSRFRFGLILLILYIIAFGRAREEDVVFGSFLLFLFSSLAAMVVARISQINFLQGKAMTRFSRSWLITLIGVVGVLIGFSALVGVLITGRLSFFFQWLSSAAQWLVFAILFLFSLPWLLISYLIEPLLPLLQDVLLEAPTLAPLPTLDFEQMATPMPERAYPAPEPLVFAPYIFSVIFWLIVLVLAFVLFRRLGSRWFSRRNLSPAEAEALLDSDGMLRMLRQALRKQVKDAADAVGSRLRGRKAEERAQRIREIYWQLLELCKSLERPRPEYQTPIEFLPTLAELFPTRVQDVQMITQAYIRVRYGEYPEDPQEVRDVETAWDRISTEAERIK